MLSSSSSSLDDDQRKKENDQHQKDDSSLMSSRMGLNDHKAGMQNLDREKINQIIYEASKGSKFFENEKKKDEQVNQRIAEQQKKISRIQEFELAAAEKEADVILQSLEQLRDLTRTIVHIDMDAFYAAVETRDNPSLQHKPMAVGGNSMLSTSNYVARRFGVRAAMPGFIAKKLCPQLVIIPPDFKKYTKVSRQVRSILVKYDKNFCPMSLDEAYLDFTNHLRIRKQLPEKERTVICRTCDNLDTTYCLCDPNLPRQVRLSEPYPEIPSKIESSSESLVSYHVGSSSTEDNNALTEQKTAATPELDKESLDGKKNFCSSCVRPHPGYKSQLFGFSTEDAVREMRCRIEQRTQLTASAGIAPNTLLAKICSDRNKPNGQFSISYSREAIMEFMRDLPIRKVCGIGKVTEKMLRALGVVTSSHLYKQRGLLYILYSDTSFDHFMRVSLGIGSTRVERDSERKSLSTEETFTETSKPSELYEKCLQLSDALATDLNDEGLTGRTITVKLKTVDFDVKTRSQTLLQHTADKEMIYHVASDLIKTEITACLPKPFRLRLMGVRISNLLPKTQCKKQETIECFMKKNLSAVNNISSHPDRISLPTEQNQAISTDLADSNPQSEIKPFPESPAGHYCPICNRKCPTNLRLFNAHIDKCLLSGENSRPSRKQKSPSLNENFLTDNTAQNSTPLKTSKKCRRRPSKRMSQITLETVSSQDDFTDKTASEHQGENSADMDIAKEMSPECDNPASPVFAQSTEFKRSISETEEIEDSGCGEKSQSTSLEIGDTTEKASISPHRLTDFCEENDQQIACKIPNVNQCRSEMNLASSLKSAVDPSDIVLSPVDLKTKSSKINSLLEGNHSKDEIPINELSKVPKTDNNSLLPLNNFKKTLDCGLSGEPIDENSSEEEPPILRIPASTNKEEFQEVKLSPKAKVSSVPAMSLADQNKKNWLKMLQKCTRKDSENSATLNEEQSTKTNKKTRAKPNSISPLKKKPSSNPKSTGEEKSKSVRSLLQYFHPTGTKSCDQTLENSDPVPQIIIQKETHSLHIPKKENTLSLPTDQVLSLSNCDNSENSSNKIHPFESNDIVLSKDELKCHEIESVTSAETNQSLLNHIDSLSNQPNVLNQFEEISCDKAKLIQTERLSQPSNSVDSEVMVECEQSQVTTSPTSPPSHDESITDSHDEKSLLDRTPCFSNNRYTTSSMQQCLASPNYDEETDEDESSSEENFSQPFREPGCELAEEESSCQSEKKPETSLQNCLQPAQSPNCKESQEDANGDILTCPVCSKQVIASDMTEFNEHVDVCLNQGVIHNILVEQGQELRRTESAKRRADLLSPMMKSNKKKKFKIGTNSSKDRKTLTLDSFFR